MVGEIKETALSSKFRKSEEQRRKKMIDLKDNGLWLEVLLTQLAPDGSIHEASPLTSKIDVSQNQVSNSKFFFEESLARLQFDIEDQNK